MVGEQIVLVNRVGEPLTFIADGQQHQLQPGDNYGFVDSQARFAMEQNPLMGTEDYYTLEFRSLVGVRKSVNNKLVDKTPCEPISDEDMLTAMECIERFDRKDSGLAPVKYVKPRHRMPRGRVADGVTGSVIATSRG
jgi:hypothetical protein